jgi:hypothetical protein
MRMLAYLRRHHLALLALFVALGGSSMAATNALLPRHSVGTPQLKNRAVTKAKIANNSVGSGKIIDHSLQKVDLTKNAAQAFKGATGPPGPRGPKGTARAYAEVRANGSILAGKSYNVNGVTRTGKGVYCVALPSPAIRAAAAVAVVTPFFGHDSTSAGAPGSIAHVEFAGSCGRNGERVRTYEVNNGQSVALHDEAFIIVIP